MPRKATTPRRPPRRTTSGVSAPVLDPAEELCARDVTDGLPVVPPTRESVQRALDGVGPVDELIARVQPADEENPMTEYLDPTDSVAVPRKTAPRPPSLDGKVVTLLDISKAKGDHLLDRLEELLRARTGAKAIVRRRKPTFARPAPDALRREIVGATDVVIEALAD